MFFKEFDNTLFLGVIIQSNYLVKYLVVAIVLTWNKMYSWDITDLLLCVFQWLCWQWLCCICMIITQVRSVFTPDNLSL